MRYAASMFIGETTGGVAQPVFYDTHTSIWNNRPPGTLITGSPGSGKTFFALLLATLNSILGKTTIVLDPKGDFISLIQLKNELGPVNLMNLGPQGSRTRAGLLDPFYLTNDAGEKLSLIIAVIDLFVGGLDDDQFTAISPIIKDVINDPNPSLLRVVAHLRASRDNPIARNLGTRLDVVSKMPGAKICFSPGNPNQTTLSISKGITVMTLIGMNLPADADEARNTNEGRLASGILYLVTNFIRRVMHNDDTENPKLLIIDEAWSVISSKQGADAVKAVALLGRSKNLALTLVTQSTSHLTHLDVDNTITSRFAFRTSQKEAAEIVQAMDLPREVGFEGLLTSLGNGECLMQDWEGRYSRVQISQWRKDWAEAFNTNPLDKLNKKRADAQKLAARAPQINSA